MGEKPVNGARKQEVYIDPNAKQGSIITNNLMGMLCSDFTTLDPNNDGRENVLVMMDAFSNLTLAVVTPNQQVKPVTKAQ